MKKAKCTHKRPDEHKLVVSYLEATIIYGNGQEPSVVLYMDTTEYLERTMLKGNKIIWVAKHKTGHFKGPAKIAIDHQMFAYLLKSYHHNIRQKMKVAS